VTYAADAAGVAESVRLCIDTGVAGLSIEDATGVPDRPLFDLPEALDRVPAVRAAIDESGADVLLAARAECFLVGHPDPLRESIRRLQAFARGRGRRPLRARPALRLLAGTMSAHLIAWCRASMLRPECPLASQDDMNIPVSVDDGPAIRRTIREHHAGWKKAQERNK
jgi:hypothetical protein